MSDHKQVLIFGSFTEDESRLFQSKSIIKDEPVENVRLQFGSLDFASIAPVRSFGTESKQVDSSVRSNNTQALKAVTKDGTCKDSKAPINPDAQNVFPSQLNGSSNVYCSLSNGVIEKGKDNSVLGSMNISETRTDKPEIFSSPELHGVLVEKRFGTESKQVDSIVRSNNTQALKAVTKDRTCKDAKAPINPDAQNVFPSQSNGSSNVYCSLSNGVIEKGKDISVLGSMNMSESRTGKREISASPELHGVLVEKSFGSENKQEDSTVRSKSTQASKVAIKDRTCKDRKTPINTDAQNVCWSESNGITDSYSVSNGVAEKGKDTSGLGLVDIAETRTDYREISTISEVHGDLIEKLKDGDTSVNSYTAPVSDVHKTSDEQVPLVKSLLPRGLINSGNLCFLNATLQALLSCSPFVQLLQDLKVRNFPKVGYPTLHAFMEFISDFGIPNDSNLKIERGILETGKSFNPTMFDSVLKKFTPGLASSLSGRPRQEDAQEFLSFIMDQMHDELLKLEGQLSSSNEGRSPLISSSEDDGWETVGPKNKSAVTRTQSFMPSELSSIFGGQLRSVVKAKGNKASATVQPFLLLHLDIFPEAVYSIEDALHLFSASETLEGYRTSAGKAGVVSASKSVKIQTLSKIMILHLMRFSYGSKGSTKLHKPISFPLELILGRELLVSPSAEGRKYELVATITHHGRDPSKGHYTADTRYTNGQWLRYDDATVTAVGVNKVLHDQPYLLFYQQV